MEQREGPVAGGGEPWVVAVNYWWEGGGLGEGAVHARTFAVVVCPWREKGALPLGGLARLGGAG